MINKILTYNSIDEYGQHIIPVNTISDMCKTASPGYSADILNYVSSMKREPIFYYTLINSVGAEEVWGSNGNGDGFPRAGVSHKSFPSDMGTPDDYGYKTFEYYANFFKHHVNKPDSPKFGKIFFSHYNPIIDRVELIVGLFVDKAKDMIDKIENGEDIAVSMGARVPYDICSICGNKAKTRAEYCTHASEYMNHIVDRNLAEQWSKQLGKVILPGTKVYVINDFPKFFDISYVYKGADKTAFVLGKVARKFHNVDIQLSSELAEAYGINDDWFEKEAGNKTATISKRSAIIKAIPGSSKPISIPTIMQKALSERANNVISTQPFFRHSVLDDLVERCSLSDIFSTMVMSGIHPKPLEFQRIVIMKAGNKGLADNLDK